MTNGEIIQKVFTCKVCEPIPEDDIIHVIFSDKSDSAIGFDWSWWNAEYKEPSIKNNLGVDCISREQALVAIRNLYPSMPRVDFNGSLRKWVDKYKPYIECDDAIKQLPSVTPQEPKEITLEDVKGYCKPRLLTIITNELYHELTHHKIKTLDQELVLDKLKAEIDKIYEREGSSFDCLNALDELKEFIDKYKADKEQTDGKNI